MNSYPRPQIRSHAFTLVELLTVIAIIAILMGLLFPAIAIVKEQARKAQAKSDVTQIVAAVKAYYTEYGKYPPVGTGTGDVVVGPSEGGGKNDNHRLFNVLRSIDAEPNGNYALNPRRIVFFEGKSATDPDLPKGGFVDTAGKGVAGGFYDPWGRQYGVVIDSDYDDTVAVSTIYKDFTTVRAGVAAFAMGKDNIVGDKSFKDRFKSTSGKPSDDVISWQ